MGLLNYDLSQIMGQFQPTDADREEARRTAALAAGFGLLAPTQHRGATGFFDALSRGGLLAVNAYNTELGNAAKRRQSGFSGAMQAYKLNRDMANQDAMQKLVFGDPQAQSPQQVAMGSMPSLAPTVSNAAELSKRTEGATLLSPKSPVSQRYGIPQEALAAVMAAGKYDEIGKMIADAAKPHFSNGVGFQRDPVSGGYRFIGGMASPGSFPVEQDGKGGLRVSPIQGMQEAAAGLEGAKTRATEGARAAFDLVDVPDGRGGTVKMTRAQAIEALGGGARAASQEIPPEVLEAARTGRPFTAQVPPGGSPQVNFHPGSLGSGSYGQLGQAISKADEAAQVGRVNTQLGVTNSLNDDFVKNSYRPVMDAADRAGNVLARVQALQKSGMLEKTGWGATQRLYAGSVLAAMGVKDASKYAADGETFRKLLMDTNWELLNAAKGPQTEGDAQRALQTFVQLGNQPAANRFILDYTAAASRLAKEKAKHYAEEVQRRGGNDDLSRIEQSWFEKNRSLWDQPEMRKWAGDGVANPSPASVTLPSGKVMRFPSEAAANAFKKQAGLQ
jgi:hypothetical protein